MSDDETIARLTAERDAARADAAEGRAIVRRLIGIHDNTTDIADAYADARDWLAKVPA